MTARSLLLPLPPLPRYAARVYATVALNAAPFGSRAYCQALSELAGVKIRKARVYAMADRGYVSDFTATKCAAAMRRWHGRVNEPVAGLRSFGSLVTLVPPDALTQAFASMFARTHVIRERSGPAAHGALSVALGLPAPTLTQHGGRWDAEADVNATLNAAVPQGMRLTRPVVIAVAMPPDWPSDDHWRWAGALMRRCQSGVGRAPRYCGLYVVVSHRGYDPAPHHPPKVEATRGIIRLVG